MKAEKALVKQPKEFNPVAYTITFESEAEINQFYAIFNTGPIAKTMNALDFSTMRRTILGETNPSMRSIEHGRLKDGLYESYGQSK